MAAKQRPATEYARVVADELVIVLVATAVPWVEAETGDLVQADGADEILAHERSAARGNAAAAFDAAVELVDSLRQLGFHAFLDPRQVRVIVAGMDPGLKALAHGAHPFAGIDR